LHCLRQEAGNVFSLWHKVIFVPQLLYPKLSVGDANEKIMYSGSVWGGKENEKARGLEAPALEQHVNIGVGRWELSTGPAGTCRAGIIRANGIRIDPRGT